ncbi:MAG TPA: hypothetical protein VJR29_11100 [bacterium]|nr:hypothetical protein [bacterium]
MSDKQRKKALNAGELPKWRPYVASSHVSGTYTPKGVKPLRPAAGAVPERATGSVSRPAGRGTTHKVNVPHPNNALGVMPRPKPGYQLLLGATMTYGGETKLNNGKPIDANYFEDAHLL